MHKLSAVAYRSLTASLTPSTCCLCPLSSTRLAQTSLGYRHASTSSARPGIRRSSYEYDTQTQQWIKQSNTGRVRQAMRQRQEVLDEEHNVQNRQLRAAEAASIQAVGDTVHGLPITPSPKEVDEVIASQKDDSRPNRYVRGQDSASLQVGRVLPPFTTWTYVSQQVRLGESFQGIKMPIRPSPPESDQCCMSGCPRCVYDVYTEDLQLYHEATSSARARLRKMGVAEATWPKQLQVSSVARKVADTQAMAGGSEEDEELAAQMAAEEVSYEIRELDISLRT